MQIAHALAAESDGVLTRQLLREIGLTRWDVRRELRNRRWVAVGAKCMVLHTGPRTVRADWRIAVHEVGGHCALDGVTALIAAGLRDVHTHPIHLSVPRGARPDRHPGTVVHETRRRRDDDVLVNDIRRVRPAVAAVRAALWAPSDRRAALMLVMPVQQRLVTAAAIGEHVAAIRRDRRRRLLNLVAGDLMDGVRALGELDFARLCRASGVPRPHRQAVRTGRRGRVYLDAHWEDCNLTAEVEGVHHGEGETQIDDALRQNALTIQGSRVLRIPLLGLRVAPRQFMEQVRQARAALRAS